MILLALVLGSPGRSDAAQAALKVNGEFALGYDSNTANNQEQPEQYSSSLAASTLNLEYTHRFSLYTSLSLRGSLNLEGYRRFHSLNNAKASVVARLSHKPGGGLFTPSFALWTSASYWDWASELRDSNEYRIGIFMLEPLSTAISARVSIAALRRDAQSRVYDLRSKSAAFNLDWVLNTQLSLYGGFQYQDGDIVSTSRAPAPQLANAAEVIENDDAYAEVSPAQVAYRLEARTRVGTLGFNYAFSRRYALDAQMQTVKSTARLGNEYQRHISLVSILARF